MNSVIGSNIKILREQKAWTQEQLARAADISTRTVQRVDAGQPAQAEVLQALAGALDTDLVLLRTDFVALAEAVKKAGDGAARRLFIKVDRIERPSDLLRHVGSHMFLFDASRLQDETDQDLAAQLDEELRDMNDICGDVGPVEQREWAKRAFEVVATLRERGAVVAQGVHRGRWRQKGVPDSSPLDWSTHVVIVTPDAEFKPLVGWDVGEELPLT